MRKLCFLFFSIWITAANAQELFQSIEGVSSKVSSFENINGIKGSGGKTNQGAKGNAFEWIKPGESKTNFISYVDVINRLTDLKSLSIKPLEGEKSAMWSSYDRKSKVDPTNGQFIHWAANNDGLDPQYIRKEGENMVLAEMKGPGAIVRSWSASPSKGHIKIYIDENPVPAIDLPFIEFFNPNSIPAFQYPELVYETAAKGFNNYVPITYQRSCKIIAEPGWGQYYQFNYISFPATVKVGSFEKNPNAESASALKMVNNFFTNKLGSLPYTVANAENKKLTSKLEPGKKQTFSFTGSKAIYALKAMLKNADSTRLDEILRKVILQIHWDGEKEPSVWSPIGDFFGSSPGYNLYKTLPMGMTSEGMYSYWYMPFQKTATISLVNNVDIPVSFDLHVGLEPLKGSIKDYSRFHAKWHRNLPSLNDSTRWPDWTVLETKGTGRFLGMSLLVWNPKGGSCKQYGAEGQHWWGEGDEKFFVDEEPFPSTFGTGTEDYFGYAWCIPNYFTKAFHSQSRTDRNMGYQSLNRWQIIDNVPFQKSFKGYLEKYFPDTWPTQYAALPYWYLDSEGVDPIKETPVKELYGYEHTYKVYRIPKAIEGEVLNVQKNTGGWASNDVFSDERLYDSVSGHKAFIWFGNKGMENELISTFNIEKSGNYRLVARIIKTTDGGRFKGFINNTPIQKVIECKSENPIGAIEMVDLGNFTLEKGKNEFKFNWLEIDGMGSRLMLDCIILE